MKEIERTKAIAQEKMNTFCLYITQKREKEEAEEKKEAELKNESLTNCLDVFKRRTDDEQIIKPKNGEDVKFGRFTFNWPKEHEII